MYKKQREFYLKILEEDQIKNLEDLTNFESKKIHNLIKIIDDE